VSVKLHAGEAELDEHLVRGLLAEQFPQWARLPLAPVASSGTVNLLYRLGAELVVRLPRIPTDSAQAALEQRWLPRLSAAPLPLEIPVPLGAGRPSRRYPGTWSVQRWVDGEDADSAQLLDPEQAGTDLGRFVAALHQIGTAGEPPRPNRGKPLAGNDAGVRSALATLRRLPDDAPSTRGLDLDAAERAWTRTLRATDWSGPPVWFHGDLLPGNLLVRDGRFVAVIDFECFGVGDPAIDAMAAWTVLPAAGRPAFRIAAGFDPATWARGRGWALVMGLIALPYYRLTNPEFARVARRAVDEALDDRPPGGRAERAGRGRMPRCLSYRRSRRSPDSSASD
jgi:aminoglycoside phosphotransferase (APT) family kinase protein